MDEKPSNRDQVLSDFVRMKIREWEESGREQQELADKAGFAKSTVSQVKGGTGVGAKTSEKWARALGFADVEAMVDAAYEWRKGTGADLDRLLAEEPVQEAIKLTLGLRAEVKRAQIEAILAAYTHARFRGRDIYFWIETLKVELDLDREIAARENVEANERATRMRAAARDAERTRKAWEKAGQLKNKLEELTPLPPSPPAAPPVSERPIKKRSKAAG